MALSHRLVEELGHSPWALLLRVLYRLLEVLLNQVLRWQDGVMMSVVNVDIRVRPLLVLARRPIGLAISD